MKNNSFRGVYQTFAITTNINNNINIQIPRFQTTGASISLDFVSEGYYDGKGNKVIGVDLAPSEDKDDEETK